MEKIPSEILEIILSSPRLTFEDILNFGATSKYFYSLVQESSYIWKKKYAQKWPNFVKLFDISFNSWYSEILYMNGLLCRARQLLSTMSPRFYKEGELSDKDFEDWALLLEETPQAYHYMVFYLMNILKDCSPIKSIYVVPIDTPGNKTFQYYAQKALRFIRQKHLEKVWLQFQSLPPKEQLLENGAIFVAQWCQPAINVDADEIGLKLDNLAKEVLLEIQCQYPNHPLLKVSEDVLLNWKLNNIDENQWNVKECKQILEYLIFVLYDNHKFNDNSVAYYRPENSYINEVLDRKQGLPIILSVIFESVARRLGIKCEPYAFPSHFLLKFTEGCGKDIGDSYYIDVFNHGNIIPKGRCPHNTRGIPENPHEDIKSATPQEVVERMANNLQIAGGQYCVPRTRLTELRSVLELLYVINPLDLQNIISLSRMYMMHGVDTKPLLIHLKSAKFHSIIPNQVSLIQRMLEDHGSHQGHHFDEPISEPEPKVRPKVLKYAVGMVMTRVSLDHQCIIYGWDPVCKVSWQNQIGIKSTYCGSEEPFYKVLAEDGSNYYSPQEDLIPTKPLELLFDLNEIGKYFSHFFGTHFVPNAEMENEHQQDAEVRHRFYQQMQFGF